MSYDVDELLYRQLFDESVPADQFLSAWEEDIGDPSQELCVRQFVYKAPKVGKTTVFVFFGGLVATEDKRGRWQAWETRERVEDRDYYRAWNEYCRAGWTAKTPTIEGTFATRTLEGWRGKDRVFRKVEGRLKDVTDGGGFVGYGKVTEWRGEFWAMPTPKLRGAI